MVRARLKRHLLALGVVIAAVAPLRSLSAHPIHMSYTEMRYTDASKVLDISIRVYANDFSAAAARRARVGLGADSLIDGRNALDYIRQHFQVVDASGRALVPTSCGVVRSQDMLKFCFRLTMPRGMTGTRIRNTVLTELFGDQVNVVQSVAAKGRTSRMFVRGDGWKSL